MGGRCVPMVCNNRCAADPGSPLLLSRAAVQAVGAAAPSRGNRRESSPHQRLPRPKGDRSGYVRADEVLPQERESIDPNGGRSSPLQCVEAQASEPLPRSLPHSHAGAPLVEEVGTLKSSGAAGQGGGLPGAWPSQSPGPVR